MNKHKYVGSYHSISITPPKPESSEWRVAHLEKGLRITTSENRGHDMTLTSAKGLAATILRMAEEQAECNE